MLSLLFDLVVRKLNRLITFSSLSCFLSFFFLSFFFSFFFFFFFFSSSSSSLFCFPGGMAGKRPAAEAVFEAGLSRKRRAVAHARYVAIKQAAGEAAGCTWSCSSDEVEKREMKGNEMMK